MPDDRKPDSTSATMDIQTELYALTGDTKNPIQVRNRLLAAKVIAEDVLGDATEEAVLAVFDQLRVAAEMAGPFDGMADELH